MAYMFNFLQQREFNICPTHIENKYCHSQVQYCVLLCCQMYLEIFFYFTSKLDLMQEASKL